jgi:hypothetical protein
MASTGHRRYNVERAARPGDGLTQIPYVSLTEGIIRRERLSLPMRRLCFMLLLAGLLTPAALAAPLAAGDGTLSGAKINGNVTISARGAIWGQIDNGTLTVVDRDPADGPAPLVSGYESKSPSTTNELGAVSTLYSGRDIHFQIGGGAYRVAMHGTGIDFSAVGSGKARFDAWLGPAPGRFAVGDGDWQPVPYLAQTVWFPISSASATTTTTP